MYFRLDEFIIAVVNILVGLQVLEHLQGELVQLLSEEDLWRGAKQTADLFQPTGEHNPTLYG